MSGSVVNFQLPCSRSPCIAIGSSQVFCYGLARDVSPFEGGNSDFGMSFMAIVADASGVCFLEFCLRVMVMVVECRIPKRFYVRIVELHILSCFASCLCQHV